MGDDRNVGCHGHVRVLAGTASTGGPVYEVLPANVVGHNEYVILGSPGLTYGFAAGDHLLVARDGTFEVLRRGGNLCLRLYPDTCPSDSDLAALTTTFGRLDGQVEMPPDRRFIVITVPVEVGFPATENAIGQWSDEHGCVWEYGNVYDDQGNALNWWDNN